MRKPMLLATLVVMVVTACRAEANVSLVVDDDGSGSVTVEFGLDEELREVITSMGGESPEEMFDLPEGDDVETRVEGGMTFYSSTREFADTAELDETLNELENTDVQLGDLDLVIEDGGARLDAVLVAPDAGEAAGDLGAGVDALDEIISANFYAALPGNVEESNADQVLSDGRLRWTIPIDGSRLEIHAVTSAAGDGAPVGMILAITVVALLLIAALVWSSRRRRSPEDAITTTPAPPPPQPIHDAGQEDVTPSPSVPPQPASDQPSAGSGGGDDDEHEPERSGEGGDTGPT